MGRPPVYGSQKWIEKFGLNALNENNPIKQQIKPKSKVVKLKLKKKTSEQKSNIKVIATSDDVNPKRKMADASISDDDDEESTKKVILFND